LTASPRNETLTLLFDRKRLSDGVWSGDTAAYDLCCRYVVFLKSLCVALGMRASLEVVPTEKLRPVVAPLVNVLQNKSVRALINRFESHVRRRACVRWCTRVVVLLEGGSE
jgi:hypothetical protein